MAEESYLQGASAFFHLDNSLSREQTPAARFSGQIYGIQKLVITHVLCF